MTLNDNQRLVFHQRLESIDQFRGFAILLMVLANYSSDVQCVPAWLKHTPDIGLTVTDLIAPLFIFAIGLTYGLSARRRLEDSGLRATIEHFFRRSMVLVGIGSILSAGEIALGYNPGGVNWGVLQAIGIAILTNLPFVTLPTLARGAIGLCALAVYQFLLDAFWLQDVLAAPHGGIPGALSWSAMLMLVTVLADVFHNPRGRKWFLWLCLGGVMIGLAASPWAPISKNRVSASYVLLSLGVSGVLFAVFHFFAERFHLRLPVLSAWGRNPLLLYGLHYLLLGLLVVPGIPAWHVAAPPWLAVLQALAIVLILSCLGLWLDRRRFYVVL